MKPTLVLYNGRIYTMDAQRPFVAALAIAGDTIIAIGEDDAITQLATADTLVVDLEGRCVTPGLVDAHVHFQSFALYLQRLNLMDVPSLAEAQQRVGAAAATLAGDQWLQGRGWTQALWDGQTFPTAADLDGVAAGVPAFLVHKSGHAAWVNSAALRRAGIDATTPDPAGGQVQRDEQGEPTGILLETAIDLVRTYIPVATAGEIAAAMLAAQPHCWQAGLTGIHDFDGRRAFQALQMLHAEEELGLRVVKNIPAARMEHAIGVGLRSGFGDDWLRIGGVKIFADGALGPRTAHMIEPYAGEPDNRGMAVTDKEEMMALASEASANGLSVTVHAIGDRANHDVLDVYAAVRREEAQRKEAGAGRGVLTPERQLRHRIEHVQLLHPADQERLAQLAVIASMQPIHATSDMQMADHFWGERARHAYAWRTVLASGATLVFGSDAPVEPIAPLPGIHAAVTRRRADGSPGVEGWYGEERLTVAEAVHAFTAAAAFTAGQEQRLGTIAAGKLADLTIFDADLFAIPEEDLLDVGIAGTIVGGAFRYRTW